MRPAHIIVIGGSAGALGVLLRIVGDFPKNFPASLFLVLHLSPDAPSSLAEIVNCNSRLPATFAQDGEKIIPSRIYIAPPDKHLLISDNVVRLTRGPRENRSRPAIDALFRSAAQSYGRRVIAVVLSGLLDDGVHGAQVVSRCGGKVIVLEPEDAPYPQMPENAIKYDHPDFVLKAADIFAMIQRLVADSEGGRAMTQTDEAQETKGLACYVCPDCGGPLLEDGNEDLPHFRCRVGHSYSLNALLSSEDDALESALWAAVRCLQENAELKQRTAAVLDRKRANANAARLREDAEAQLEQAKLLQERIIERQKRVNTD